MSMPEPVGSAPQVKSSTLRSKFTYRHLHLLGSYSSLTPLRVIALVDYDAFYAQCEIVRLNLPETQPLAVQQWNAIIALNYAARGFGFTRGAAVEDVQRLCPDIVLQHVATWKEGDSTWAYRANAGIQANMKTEKAALDPYRVQSRKSLELIKTTLPPAPLQKIEKASVDEVFVDLSAQVHSILVARYPELSNNPGDLDTRLPLPPPDLKLDWESDNVVATGDENYDEGISPDWDDVALHIGAEVIRNLRQVIRERLKYTCSAGIAHNKALAKLGAGCKKPNQQTVIRARAVAHFLSTYKVTSIRGLGGKLGARAAEAFGKDKITDLLEVPAECMKLKLGRESGTWLYDIIRGVDNSEVIPRTDPQSMLAQKTFVPPLTDAKQAIRWLRIFAADLMSRMQDLDVETGARLPRRRRPTIVALHHHVRGRFGPTRSKQSTIPPGTPITEATLLSACSNLLRQIAADARPTWPCMAMGMSVHGFEPPTTQSRRITTFLAVDPSPHGRKRKRGDDAPNSAEQSQSNPAGGIPPRIPKDGADREPFENHGSNGATLSGRSSADIVGHPAAHDYVCPKCLEPVDELLVLEHLDWHFALDLRDRDP